MNTKFYSEMAMDQIEESNALNLVEKTSLLGGIQMSRFVLDDDFLAKRLNKGKGEYVTFDLNSPFFQNKKCDEELKKSLVKAISEISKKFVSKIPNVLVVGLGNDGLTADALGPKTVSKIKVTRHYVEEEQNHRLNAVISAISPNVLGETGIQSFDIVKGVVEKIKPELVVVVDTLCTSRLSRLYSSFQLTTAGISPASGVGARRRAFNEQSLNVPTLAIGVPLVANAREIIRDILLTYCQNENRKLNENTLNMIAFEKLKGNSIVAPKEIDLVVEECARVIADAINSSFCCKSARATLK